MSELHGSHEVDEGFGVIDEPVDGGLNVVVDDVVDEQQAVSLVPSRVYFITSLG